MDDLDRLYQHLVATVRRDAPHLLRRRFALRDVWQHLVPYRLHRRSLGFDTIQQYERTLLRLAAGERGYLAVPPLVQDGARQALAGTEPDVEVLLQVAEVPVAFAHEALEALLGGAPDAGALDAGDGLAAEARPLRTPGDGVPALRTPTAPHPAVTPTPLGADAAAAPVDHFAPAAAPTAAAAPAPDVPPHRDAPAMPFPTRPQPTVSGGACRYCAQQLPAGRPVTFCPNCGQNVTVLQCPACSTELEVGWRFCVACGRAMEPTPAER